MFRHKCLYCSIAALLLCFTGCGGSEPPPSPASADWEPHEKLSEYGLFEGDGSTQESAEGVIPYDLNTPFFSDYATKHRFVKLPDGTLATYHDSDVFEFPVGTIIVKSFSYPPQLIETRLLIHRPAGWIGLTYVWNAEQTEATLHVAGTTCDVSWTRSDGKQLDFNYIIPNVNQCLQCHENNKVLKPIGLKARNLNRDYEYADGVENQLARWWKAGVLGHGPDPETAPKAAVWDDPSTGGVEERARTWLDANCANCHNAAGGAKSSGLDLSLSQTDPYLFGVWKSPVAAGRATGGRKYDIVPGKPDESILLYRLESTDPAVMMPELTRRLVDEEGVALIREWIAGMATTAGKKNQNPMAEICWNTRTDHGRMRN